MQAAFHRTQSLFYVKVPTLFIYERLQDILPERTHQLESVKEQILALFRVHGFELVHPPLMKYSDSLLTHIDNGLSLKTIRVPDQLSGRQLGIRADITPQVARIDAHLLSQKSRD